MLGALALSITGCSSAGDHHSNGTSAGAGSSRRCVNDKNIVVDDANCQPRSSGGSTGHWYYGGSGYGTGSRVSGGSTSASDGAISRGGLGSSARGGSGAGSGVGGEGGGHGSSGGS